LDAAGMVEDASHHSIGQFEGAPSSWTVYQRETARPNAFQERTQLGFERLFGRGRQFLKSYFGLSVKGGGVASVGPHAHAKHVLASEIERNVFVLLEKTHLPHAFGGDTARGKVGDRARRELDAGVSDVNLVGDYGNAHGFQVDDFRVDQSEKNVEVVNHDVIYDIDIETARSEDAQAMNFEKHRSRHNFLGRSNGRIKSFDVSDLQDAAGSFGCGDEVVCLVQRRGHRFLDENIMAPSEKLASDAGVVLCRHGQADGVDPLGSQSAGAGKDWRAVLGGNFRGAIPVCIEDAHELGAFRLSPNADVVAAEFSDSHDRHADGLRVH
jgi:hypothetical protein